MYSNIWNLSDEKNWAIAIPNNLYNILYFIDFSFISLNKGIWVGNLNLMKLDIFNVLNSFTWILICFYIHQNQDLGGSFFFSKYSLFSNSSFPEKKLFFLLKSFFVLKKVNSSFIFSIFFFFLLKSFFKKKLLTLFPPNQGTLYYLSTATVEWISTLTK